MIQRGKGRSTGLRAFRRKKECLGAKQSLFLTQSAHPLGVPTTMYDGYNPGASMGPWLKNVFSVQPGDRMSKSDQAGNWPYLTLFLQHQLAATLSKTIRSKAGAKQNILLCIGLYSPPDSYPTSILPDAPPQNLTMRHL
eukprot:1154197-Pelagomonas_calceolata.AAC.6